MKNKELSEINLLKEMRKQFSYSVFIFALTLGLVILLLHNQAEELSPVVIATLIVYSILQANFWFKFLGQNRELRKRFKKKNSPRD